MKKQPCSRLSQTGLFLAFCAAVLVSMSVANVVNAQTVFEATTSNTTAVINSTFDLPTISGATPDLLVTNPGDAFAMGGFASSDDINTLNGTPLLATDTVTLSLTVDSLTGGQLRSQGVEFGLADTAEFRPVSGGNLILGMAGSNSGSDVRFISSFQDTGTLDFNSNQAALEDGFSITLTANSAGYSFLLEDIIVRGSTNPLYTDEDTSALITGTFSGNEFLDHFSTGHFYAAVQQFNNGAMVVDYSKASIEVGDPPAFPLGDFNMDNKVDLDDLDQYNGNIGAAATGNLQALDLDGDETVGASDLEIHYTDLVETSNGQVGTFAGDANLDGTVDVLGDAAILINNLNSASTSWGQGDFNGDGTVDVLSDAAALINNIGSTNEPAAGPATSAVPEPGTLSLFALATAGLSVRRRRLI